MKKQSLQICVNDTRNMLDELDNNLRDFNSETFISTLNESYEEGIHNIWSEYSRAKTYWEDRKDQGFTIEAALAEQYLSAMSFVLTCFNKEILPKYILEEIDVNISSR